VAFQNWKFLTDKTLKEKDAAVAKAKKEAVVDGRPEFATEHIFELQQIADLLNYDPVKKLSQKVGLAMFNKAFLDNTVENLIYLLGRTSPLWTTLSELAIRELG
jgi:hypothetical protein